MRFDRESWRKLYVAESLEHRRMSIFARGVRDYLLRHAEADGTLLRMSKSPIPDLAEALGVRRSEQRQFASCIEELVRIGYLTIDPGGRVWITKFAEAQNARTPGAVRTAEWKRRKREKETSPGDTPSGVTQSVTRSVTGDVTGDVTPDTGGDVTNRREEKRRDENTPNPSASVTASVTAGAGQPEEPDPLVARAQRVLENPFEGQFDAPAEWPEVKRAAEALSIGIGKLKFSNDPGRDSDLRAILSLFADGYTVDELEKAGEIAKRSDYFRKRSPVGPSAFTPAVLRRLLSEKPAESGPEPNGPRQSVDVSELGLHGVRFGAEGL